MNKFNWTLKSACGSQNISAGKAMHVTCKAWYVVPRASKKLQLLPDAFPLLFSGTGNS